MSDGEASESGQIVWHDLTVGDATSMKDFYADVVGWAAEPLSMGDYEDYCMNDASGQTVAGICHSKGANANLPAQWLTYVTVPDVAASAKRCEELGGDILDGPRPMSGSLFCVIRDPQGAVLALIEPGT